LPGIDTVSIFTTNGVFDTSKYENFLNSPENYNHYPWLREIERHAQTIAVPYTKLETMLGTMASPSKAKSNICIIRKSKVFLNMPRLTVLCSL
jgi:hypothetical protein